jgi:hypothetical protein
MKPTLLSAFSLFLVLANSLISQAQITLLSTDMTVVGDVVIRHNDTIPTYGPGGAGANQIWDFSSAIIDTTNTTTVVTVASTPFSSAFSSSNYAMTGGTGSYLYFTHTANAMTTTGAAGDLLGNGQQISSPFSDPLVLHQFPRTFGSRFNDTYAFITEANGAGLPTPIPVYRVKLTHTGHVYDTTDAYGTLITPTGTYDALRVKSVDFTHDILEYKLFSFSAWAVLSDKLDTSVTYTWHSKLEKLAIAEYAYDSIDNPARFTFSTVPPPLTTDIDDRGSEVGFKVFPSPATDRIWIAASDVQLGNTNAEIFTLDGRMILTQQVIGNSIDISTLHTGMYMLRTLDKNGIPSKPIKFLVE